MKPNTSKALLGFPIAQTPLALDALNPRKAVAPQPTFLGVSVQ